VAFCLLSRISYHSFVLLLLLNVMLGVLHTALLFRLVQV
jgi:hypothetical protein